MTDMFTDNQDWLEKQRKDFILFINEYDKRRGKNFLETFPEMEDFYNSCKKFEDSFIINNIKKSIDVIELKKPIESKKFPLWYKFIFFGLTNSDFFISLNRYTFCKKVYMWNF